MDGGSEEEEEVRFDDVENVCVPFDNWSRLNQFRQLIHLLQGLAHT